MRFFPAVPITAFSLVLASCGGSDATGDAEILAAIDGETTTSIEITLPPETRSTAPTSAAASPLVTVDAPPGSFVISTTTQAPATRPTTSEDGESSDEGDDTVAETTTTTAPLGPWIIFEGDSNPVATFTARLDPTATSTYPTWPGIIDQAAGTACADGSDFNTAREIFGGRSSALLRVDGNAWIFTLTGSSSDDGCVVEIPPVEEGEDPAKDG